MHKFKTINQARLLARKSIRINTIKWLEAAAEFFRISMAHEDLVSYYKLNFALMQHHKYSLTELENMIPWEREIYVSLLQQFVEEENLKAQQERNG